MPLVDYIFSNKITNFKVLELISTVLKTPSKMLKNKKVSPDIGIFNTWVPGSIFIRVSLHEVLIKKVGAINLLYLSHE